MTDEIPHKSKGVIIMPKAERDVARLNLDVRVLPLFIWNAAVVCLDPRGGIKKYAFLTPATVASFSILEPWQAVAATILVNAVSNKVLRVYEPTETKRNALLQAHHEQNRND